MGLISFNVELGHTPKKWYLRANLREYAKNPAYRDVRGSAICDTGGEGIVNLNRGDRKRQI